MPSVFWLIKFILLGPLLRLAFRPWIVGEANVPASGPVIIASNHLSGWDTVLLPLRLRRHVAFLAKSEFFAGRGAVGRVRAWFFRAIGQIPVDRGGGRAAQGALDSGLSRLRAGGVLGIYPEGTRSPDGRLYRGRTGVARLILAAQAPVVPVAMVGTDELLRPGSRLPRPHRAGMIVGEPLDFSRFAGREDDPRALREVTDEVMRAIQRLSGQERVDAEYGSQAKRRLAAARS